MMLYNKFKGMTNMNYYHEIDEVELFDDDQICQLSKSQYGFYLCNNCMECLNEDVEDEFYNF
jgi:hypothetical protein